MELKIGSRLWDYKGQDYVVMGEFNKCGNWEELDEGTPRRKVDSFTYMGEDNYTCNDCNAEVKGEYADDERDED